jgi:transmembrane sensor
MRNHGHHTVNRAGLYSEARGWLLRLTSEHATTSDAQAFKSWCEQSSAHVEAFAEIRRLWENLGPAARRFSAREQVNMPTQNRSAVFKARMHSTRISRRAFLGGAVAASAALVLLRPPFQLWPALSDMVADYRTATGEQRTVKIGSDIVLNMNTQTRVNLRTSSGRPIGIDLLGGEIQVRTAEPSATAFTVFAGGGRVEVAGQAKCNVRCLSSGVQVTGLDGSTTLEYDGNREVLQSAQRVHYGNGSLGSASPANIEVVMGWRRRVLIFDGEPLAYVVEEINRYRLGKIILTNDRLAARKVQARFSLNQLPQVAALIHDAYGAIITSLPGGIVLLS